MALTATKKTKSEARILDESTLRLLRGIKEKLNGKSKELGRDALLKQGYSERFIAKVEKA